MSRLLYVSVHLYWDMMLFRVMNLRATVLKVTSSNTAVHMDLYSAMGLSLASVSNVTAVKREDLLFSQMSHTTTEGARNFGRSGSQPPLQHVRKAKLRAKESLSSWPSPLACRADFPASPNSYSWSWTGP